MPDTWPFPDQFSARWRATAALLRLPSLITLKFLLRSTQKVQTINLVQLERAIQKRPKGTPLVTVCNHSSCVDDPLMWGLFPARWGLFRRSSRWIPAAKEVCFTRKIYSIFFSRCHLVPVVRGDGVYQKAMNFCLKQLNEGSWVHIFPEGKVNLTGECMRLKWGVGRLIAEATPTPMVVPFVHIGMDDILPNTRPYVPQFFKKLTVLVGEPMDFSGMLRQHREMKAGAVITRKLITDSIQEKLAELRTQAESLHNSWAAKSLVEYRTL